MADEIYGVHRPIELTQKSAHSFLRVKRGFIKRITGEEREEERESRQRERNREAGERNREHQVKLNRYFRLNS